MQGNQTILIVDDDQDLLDMYQEMFAIPGFSLITARSATEALNVCREHPHIKVIISDSQMPEMSGLELLRQLRNHYEVMPYFYLLTGALELNESELRDQGGRALILKPFDLEEIMKRIINDLKN